MGLFSKREKEKCPICGKELMLLHQTSIEDGNEFICDDCAARLRGKFDIHSELRSSYFGSTGTRMHTEDDLRSLTLRDVREILAEKDAEAAKVLEDIGEGYDNVFRVEEVFVIDPKPLDVGLFRAKAYKNRMVAKGAMIKGSLAEKDTVSIHDNGSVTNAPILELIPCDGVGFFVNLKSHMHKKFVSEGMNAWLILDVTSSISDDAIITKQ